ncbi:MAG: hypothetical protein [Cotesia congregata filamentous virus 2]
MTESSESINDFLLSTIDNKNTPKYSNTQIREYIKFQIILLDEKIITSDLISKSLKQWYISNKSLVNLNLLNDLINKQTDLMLFCNITYILLSNATQYALKKFGFSNLNIDFEYIITYPETVNSNVITINHILKENKSNKRKKLFDTNNSYLYDILTDMTNTFLFSSIIQVLIVSFGAFNIKRREEYENNKRRINSENEKLNETVGLSTKLLKELDNELSLLDNKNHIDKSHNNSNILTDIQEFFIDDENSNENNNDTNTDDIVTSDDINKKNTDNTCLNSLREKNNNTINNNEEKEETIYQIKNIDMVNDSVKDMVNVKDHENAIIIDNNQESLLKLNDNDFISPQDISLPDDEEEEDNLIFDRDVIKKTYVSMRNNNVPTQNDTSNVTTLSSQQIKNNSFISGSFVDHSIYESASVF